MVVAAANKAPKYMKEAGYRCPTDPQDGLVQYAFQTKLTTFEFLSSMPSMLKDFNMFMGNTMGARNYWVDWFPVHERLLEGAKQDSALLVDVGGGKGHDLLAFHEKYPGQGRLVLQDTPSVTNSIQGLDSAVELMTYDFFTEQPVHGMSGVLSDRSNRTSLTWRQGRAVTSITTSCTTGPTSSVYRY